MVNGFDVIVEFPRKTPDPVLFIVNGWCDFRPIYKANQTESQKPFYNEYNQ